MNTYPPSVLAPDNWVADIAGPVTGLQETNQGLAHLAQGH